MHCRTYASGSEGSSFDLGLVVTPCKAQGSNQIYLVGRIAMIQVQCIQVWPMFLDVDSDDVLRAPTNQEVGRVENIDPAHQ